MKKLDNFKEVWRYIKNDTRKWWDLVIKKKAKIKNISNEMRKQNNRCTQYPLFVIVDTVLRAAPYGQEDGRERIEETEPDSLCHSCLIRYQQDEDIPNECRDCEPKAFNYYIEVEEPQLEYGVFFTAKACDDCITSNHYHFRKPRSYGIGSYRNYEMQAVQQHLLSLTGNIPSHYS